MSDSSLETPLQIVGVIYLLCAASDALLLTRFDTLLNNVQDIIQDFIEHPLRKNISLGTFASWRHNLALFVFNCLEFYLGVLGFFFSATNRKQMVLFLLYGIIGVEGLAGSWFHLLHGKHICQSTVSDYVVFWISWNSTLLDLLQGAIKGNRDEKRVLTLPEVSVRDGVLMLKKTTSFGSIDFIILSFSK